MKPAQQSRTVLAFPASGLMVPEELAAQWTAAYHVYVQAVEMPPEAPGVARAMAEASWSVAGLWREIAQVPALPWWSSAAASTAAEAFEVQASEWAMRAGQRGRAGGRR
ncbi:hypothetical protein DFQ13_102213 [Actinokineospora spheciospongiae]|nr:hypothetical protein DFQ13_102213 [Actinokineospora spheciospongiae]